VTPFPLPVQATFNNSNAAIARGAEWGVTYRTKPGQSLYANYTYEHISDSRQAATVNRGTPAHMVNIGGVTPLGRGFSLGANVGLKTTTSCLRLVAT